MFFCAPLEYSEKYFTVSFGDDPVPGTPKLKIAVSILFLAAKSFERLLNAATLSLKFV